MLQTYISIVVFIYVVKIIHVVLLKMFFFDQDNRVAKYREIASNAIIKGFRNYFMLATECGSHSFETK